MLLAGLVSSSSSRYEIQLHLHRYHVCPEAGYGGEERLPTSPRAILNKGSKQPINGLEPLLYSVGAEQKPSQANVGEVIPRLQGQVFKAPAALLDGVTGVPGSFNPRCLNQSYLILSVLMNLSGDGWTSIMAVMGCICSSTFMGRSVRRIRTRQRVCDCEG